MVGAVDQFCQIPKSVAVVIAGVAGSGKTTLGRALSAAIRAPLLDLDTVTNPLLDGLPHGVLGEHWLAAEHGPQIRQARYAALTATAAEVLASAGSVVLVAPFTAELRGGREWQQLASAFGTADVHVVQVIGDEALFAARRNSRGEPRDAHRPASDNSRGAVTTFFVDADLSTSQQLARLLPALGHRRSVDASAPIFNQTFDAVLFDLDGTLVDSTASVVRSWRRFATDYGVSSEALHANHGQPADVLIGKLLDDDKWTEGLARITELEVSDAVDLQPVRGAATFYDTVPAAQRAIVTSGSIPIATARLKSAGFPIPGVFVTADDITHGKPDPEPYLVAAQRLGVDPARCLVVEDATAGITAGDRAGCRVLALTGTVSESDLAAADLVVDGLDRVKFEQTPEGLRLQPR